MSPIDQLKLTIQNADSSQIFANSFFKNGMQTRGLIQYTGDLSEEKKRNFVEKFESMASGLKNAHRIAVMPFGYQYTPLSVSMSDAQFLENADLTMRQIAAAFGIKPHQIGDLTRSTHSNIEHQQQQFYTDTTQIKITANEQEMTYKLLTDEEILAGYHVKINIDAILRADLKTRYEAYASAVSAGVITVNEARRKEDLPPLAGGDMLVVNGSMIPLEQAGVQYSKGGDENR